MIFTSSLKKNEEFKRVYNKGKAFRNRYLVMYVLDNGLEENRIGISVSKKVGNSVVRHRIKRLIKESYRLHEEMFHSSWDIVVVARVESKDKSLKSIEGSLLHLLNLHLKNVKEKLESN